MEIREILYRVRRGESDRAISRDLKLNRKTVRKYREWGAEQGLLEGELPSQAELHQRLEATLPAVAPPQQVSSVEPYREQVVAPRDAQTARS